MAVQNIDFLPIAYREGRLLRRKQLWRRGVLLVFLACIIAGTIEQRRARIRLEATRDRLQEEAGRMTAQLENPESLRKQIQELDARANLLTFLQVRVPPTRVLAALTNPLPPFVTLNEVSLKNETVTVLAVPGELPPAAAAKTVTNPHQADLQRLVDQAKSSELVVTVSGIAPDDVAIARYLAALQDQKLFREVKLLYTDEHTLLEHPRRRFGLRLTLRRPAKVAPAETPATPAGGRPVSRSLSPGAKEVSSAPARPFPALANRGART